MKKFYLFSTFLNIYLNMKKIKNIKISEESHDVLKKYCEEKGLKMYKFLETLILKTCQKEKDIYGE